jgi:hypothetical protein
MKSRARDGGASLFGFRNRIDFLELRDGIGETLFGN